jgi:hypothetical protein
MFGGCERAGETKSNEKSKKSIKGAWSGPRIPRRPPRPQRLQRRVGRSRASSDLMRLVALRDAPASRPRPGTSEPMKKGHLRASPPRTWPEESATPCTEEEVAAAKATSSGSCAESRPSVFYRIVISWFRTNRFLTPLIFRFSTQYLDSPATKDKLSSAIVIFLGFTVSILGDNDLRVYEGRRGWPRAL